MKTKQAVRIINELLDSYEKSSVYKGTNKVSVRPTLHINRKKFPEYFSEIRESFEEIHFAVNQLEKIGLIEVVWKDDHKNHILEKLILNLDSVDRAYEYASRIPLKNKNASAINIARNYVYGESSAKNNLGTVELEVKAPVSSRLAKHIISRLEEGRSIKAFADIDNDGDLEKLLNVLREIEVRRCNGVTETESIYVREFSIMKLGDSKALETMAGRIAAAFRQFGDFADETFEEILAEYNIYSTPNYVYFKGCGTVILGSMSPSEKNQRSAKGELQLQRLSQGIGISGEDLENIEFKDISGVHRVVTIENLTSFFRFDASDSLVIYLGGYHNNTRRRILKKINDKIPYAEYYHFGDIDAGGFEIFFDLRRKTEIDFKALYMNTETLMEYAKYTKPLTANDRLRLEHQYESIRDSKEEYLVEIRRCIRYMLDNNMKLEQECVRHKYSRK